MTLKLIALAGGLLALAAVAVAAFKRGSSSEITNEQLSGEWVAQARGKDEPW